MDVDADDAHVRCDALSTLQTQLLTNDGQGIDAVANAHALVSALRRLSTATGDELEAGHVIATLGLLVSGNRAAQIAALDAGAIASLRAVLSSSVAAHTKRLALATTYLLLDNRIAAADAGPMVFSLVRPLSQTAQSITMLALLVLRLFTRENGVGYVGIAIPLAHLVKYGYADERAEAARLLSLHSGNAAIDTSEREELTPDVAFSTLTRFVRLNPLTKIDAVATATATMNELQSARHNNCWLALLALEDLNELVTEHKTLGTSEDIVSTLVPLCVDVLAHSDVDTHQLYAARILVTLMQLNADLEHTILAAFAMENIVERIGRGHRATILVLGALVETDDPPRVAAIATGAVPILVQLIRDGRQLEQGAAIRALGVLVTGSHEAQDEALHAGAIERLLYLLRTDTIGNSPVLIALGNLVENHAPATDAFIALGGVSLLVETFVVNVSVKKLLAAKTIAALVKNHPLAQCAMTDAGILASLVRVLLEGRVTSESEAAANALGYLAENHPTNAAAIIDGPALGRLVKLVRSGLHGEKYYAACALARIADDNTTAQAALAGAGAIEALVELLETGTCDEVFVAAHAIETLVLNEPNSQRIATRAGAIAPLVALLRSPSGRTKQVAASALGRIVQNNGDAKTIAIAAGAMPLLIDMLTMPSDNFRSNAAVAIEHFVTQSPESHTLAVETGAV